MMNASLRINAERLQADFDALAEIGSTGDGGVHRPALGEAHLQARGWFRDRILEAGLAFKTDGAGNHSGLLRCGPEGAPSLLLGSHLDSVPYGGRFDGALGVLASLEILRTVQEAGLSLPFHLEAIDFTDEEGTLVGLLGSAALAGKLTAEVLESPRGGRDALQSGLARSGLSEVGLLHAGRESGSLAGYVEVHIEQGPRLVEAEVDIGIVTAITGIGSYRLSFIGRADHAGTTPMQNRLDASQGASAFTLRVRQTLLDRFSDCVANVGWIRIEPGAFNIVPARAELSLEYRSGDAETFGLLEAALLKIAHEEAQRFGLELEIENLGMHLPTPMSAGIQEAIAGAAERLGLKVLRLSSGAGHDAQSLAGLCPVGMLFVPSEGGASHSAREFTRWEDCVNGANVLLQAALRLAEHEIGD